MKRFAVIGLGRFGGYLATQLRANGCEVLGVDSDRARAEELAETLNTVIIADATDKKALSKLDLPQMDAVVVCLGEGIEASTLAVLHLRDLGVKRIIAKVSADDHARILTRLGAEQVIFPERDIAIRLANSLTWSNILDYVPLASGYTITEVAPPNDVVGKSLADSQLRTRYGVHVIAVHRMAPEEMILAPPASHVIGPDEAIIVLGKHENIEKMLGGR